MKSPYCPSPPDQISREGYTLKIYEISPEELKAKRLPPHFVSTQIAGIVGIELFDRDYIDMVSRLDIPMVLTDTPPDAITTLMDCDRVTMENIAGIMTLIRHIVKAGARRIGFVGDYNHCGSFRERWYGYHQALMENSLRFDSQCCAWLMSRLDRMPSLPDAFICANDYLAVPLMLALKKRGLSIPKDIMVTGFDGIPQSAYTDPPLTTVRIHGTEIGRLAAELLLNRIHTPAFPYSWTRVRSTPIWRESTRNV